MNEIKTSRRQFLAIGMTAVAAAAVAPSLAQAQGALPQIDEADATAAALGRPDLTSLYAIAFVDLAFGLAHLAFSRSLAPLAAPAADVPPAA